MCFDGIDPDRQQGRRHLPRLPGQFLRILEHGDRMQVDHAVDALVAVLQRRPIAQRPQIVTEGRDTGGLNAREDALHGP